MKQSKATENIVDAYDDKILVNVQPNKKITKEDEEKSHSFYVPKDSTIGHLKVFLTERILPSKYRQEISFFMFAYGSILNNHEKLGHLYQKFKGQIKHSDIGLQIKYAEMSSF